MRPLPGHRKTLTLLMLAYTLSMCDRMILSILFPDIKAEFGLSDTQLGLLGGISFALFYATMGLPIARLSDQHSRKWIIIVSLVVFSIMTALSGFAAGFISLLILRIGVGIGEAGVNPASHSIIADYFPPQRRAFAMAILMLGGSLGMMLGFVGGGLIAEAYNWRIALISVGAPGLLLAAVMARSLQEPARGAFETETPLPPPPILTSAATMWANPAMRHLVAGSVVAGLLSYGFTQWLPTFFIRAHGLTQSQTGILMASVFGILGSIGALGFGRWFDRLSHRGFQHGLDARRGSLCHPALLHRRLTGGQPGHGNSVVHYSRRGGKLCHRTHDRHGTDNVARANASRVLGRHDVVPEPNWHGPWPAAGRFVERPAHALLR